MNKRKWILAVSVGITVLVALILVILLVGRNQKAPPEQTTAGQTGITQTPLSTGEGAGTTAVIETNPGTTATQTEPPESTSPAPSETEQKPSATQPPETSKPTEPEVTEALDLEYLQFGRYNGAFVEDGTDEQVENVAVVLIKNPTEAFLEYAHVEFEIGAQTAQFDVRGLPPGAAAWVLETNRMVIPEGSVFNLLDELTSFSVYEGVGMDDLSLVMETGAITVRNTSSQTMTNVYIYYRQTHTDGNYLGGIAYRVLVETLKPDEPVTVTAGHCFPANCAIVKITHEKESP